MTDTGDRDRDSRGRARSNRPRDALGRPLPPGSVGVERVPDDLDLTPEQTLAYAQRLLNDGLAFNAHEVLESAWKSAPFEERPLWQGLVQLAVGITHIQRGNLTGARTLLRRSQARLAVAAPCHDIDTPGLLGYATDRLADLAAGRPPTDLTPPLTRRPRPDRTPPHQS